MASPLPLPIDSHLPRLIERLRSASGLVVVAEPGAGKTTRLPPAVVLGGVLPREAPRLIMLQPRRIAARASALRIAEEHNWTLGDQVGYHIRFDRVLAEHTPIRILTEGILTRQLLDDPFLPGIGAVVLDEFHERNLNADIAIALLREIQQTVRPDLKIIVMSATLDAGPVSRFLGDCPVEKIPGRTFPVEIEHAAAPLAVSPARLPGDVAGAVEKIIDRPGDVLVFLPGAEEIRRCARELEPLAHAHDLLVLPLHGSLPAEEQIRALRPANRKKIILATNIAETSLTIEGVRCVIDSGLARVAEYDARRGLDRLVLGRISKASAVQRAGRAGRTAPGTCLRLFSPRDFEAMEDFEKPEILRVDLSGALLAMHGWGKTNPADFAWFAPPPAEALLSAERLLDQLGALENGALTPLGRQMLSLPAHPRLARLLIAGAQWNLLDEAATLAALLSEKDILPRPEEPRASVRGSSDLLYRLDLLKHPHHLDPAAVRSVLRLKEPLLKIAGRSGQSRRQPAETDRQQSLLKMLLLAYPDRVCRRRQPHLPSALMCDGSGVTLAPSSIIADAEFFIALDTRTDPRNRASEPQVTLASQIEPQWLLELFPRHIRRKRELVYEPQRQRIVSEGSVSYLSLPLKEDKDAPVDAREAGAVLGEALRPMVGELFEKDEASQQWLYRLELLRRHMSEHPWPELNAEALGDLLAQASAGKKSLDEVRALPLSSILQSSLHYPLDRLLDQHAPTHIQTPAGSRIRLEYRANLPPIMAVRLQEMFGQTQTPRIANGRVSVLLHLLSPGFKPVQVTDDLSSFWKNAYFQVRKDLKVRYPRHAWPDDPLAAPPQAKGRHRAK